MDRCFWQAHLAPDRVLRAAVAADGPLMLHRGVHARHARLLPLVLCRHSHPFGLCGVKFIPGNVHAVHAIMLCRQSKPQAPFCEGCLATHPAYLHAACTQLAALLLGCWQPRRQGRGKAKFTGSCFLAATQKLLSGCDRQASRACSWTAPRAYNTDPQHTDRADPFSLPGMRCMPSGAPGGCSVMLRRGGRPRCCRSAATLGSSTACRGCHCIGW